MTYSLFLISVKQLDLHRADRFTSLFDSTADFRQKSNRRWLGFREDVYVVRCHALLCDEDFLRSIDNEIAALSKPG